MEIKDNVIQKKKVNNLYSILLFTSVLIITISLFAYNFFLKKDIERKSLEINQREASITEINKDSSIWLYNLLNNNKVVLEKFRKRSNITGIISHIKRIELKYKLNIDWFTYNWWDLSSNVIIENNTDAFAYNIAREFISGYRTDDARMFDLGFVSSIKWNDNIGFSIELKLKD